MAKVQIGLRLEEVPFHEAKEILAKLGLVFSEAVNIYTNMIVLNHCLPFDVMIPSSETRLVLGDMRSGEGSEEVSLDQLSKARS